MSRVSVVALPEEGWALAGLENWFAPQAVFREDLADVEIAARIERATGRGGDEARGALAAMNASGRFVTAEEVAAAIAFLCRPDSRSITGTCLTVDGGTTA